MPSFLLKIVLVPCKSKSKPEKYSFGGGYHTRGIPEPFQMEALLKDLLDSGGDLPNEQMALG